MSKLHVKSGDKVVVLAGKEKGKTGAVLSTDPKSKRVVVKGVNIVSKHKKPKSAQDKGGIVKLEAAIDSSNVQVICGACGKATRIAMAVNDKKQNTRICKKCGASLDTGKAVKKVKKEAVKAAPATKETAKVEDKKVTTEKTGTKAPVKAAEKPAVKAPVKAAKPAAVKAPARATRPAAVKSVVTTTSKKSSPSRKTASK